MKWSNPKWQWMDDRLGGMGWFSDEEKAEYEAEFKGGHWRPLTQAEIDRFHAYMGDLAYTQS